MIHLRPVVILFSLRTDTDAGAGEDAAASYAKTIENELDTQEKVEAGLAWYRQVRYLTVIVAFTLTAALTIAGASLKTVCSLINPG